MLFTAPDSTTSHGEEHPYDRFFRFWVFGVMLPATAVAWHCTGGRILLSLAAALVLPLLAIAQGATGILKYRLYYADAPVPLSPSHGVVIVPKSSSPRKGTAAPAAASSESHIVGSTNERQQQQHPPASVGATIPLRKTPSYPLSLGCECGVGSPHPATTFCEEAASAGTERDGPAAAMLDGGGDSRRPVRLLVIGDSLAIGVGQARQCTPIMPEVIAKTISRHLDGRTVYWTAHGSPGASTGWIVRELERGVTYLEQQPEEEQQQHQGEQSSEAATAAATAEVLQHPPPELEKSSSHSSSSCCETDDSSSDEYSLPDARNDTTATETRIAMKEQHRVWRERLAQHRKRFDPEALGPYDVVIVVTGSNDVKSEYFPILLKGEDAKFRREAMERGGDYAKELRRVLQTLNRGMRSQLQSVRDSVEAATETVIELAEETIERMGSNGLTPGKGHDFGSSYREKLEARKEASSSQILSENSENLLEQEDREGDLPRNFPLVVLPGLPARGLPLFRKAPLRWLAVPALDIQDMHKRNVARSHPEKVLFVPPPSIADLATYENCTGEFWQQHCEEETVLALRDIRQKDCRRIEGEMRDYYEVKDPRRPTGKGLQMTANCTGWLSFFSRTAAPGTSIFSVDRIHPTDDGYDFWGRYIASAIVDEWRAHPHLEPPL